MNEREFRKSLGFKDEIAYHYCSVEALYGIFSSKSFWLTCLDSSVDAMELKLAEKIITEAINELKKDYPNKEHSDIFKQIESAPQDLSYKKHRPKFKYFGLSLVEDKDSLTHWERYANNSSGVCIGLNIAVIKDLFDSYAISEIASDWLQTIQIVYTHEEQVKFAKSFIITKLNGARKDFKDFKQIDYIYSMIYYTTLASLKPFFKHIGFASEKEYRVYLNEGEAEDTARLMKNIMNTTGSDNKELFKNISNNILELASSLNVLQSNLKYRVLKDDIRSYYSLNLNEIWSDTLIPEVVLGPKCYQNKKELKNFIKACELQRTKISVSKIPIR